MNSTKLSKAMRCVCFLVALTRQRHNRPGVQVIQVGPHPALRFLRIYDIMLLSGVAIRELPLVTAQLLRDYLIFMAMA